MTENITATLKDQITAKTVTQGLMNGKSLTQIAKGMGLTREGLYLRMSKQETQELMTIEVRELETKLQGWIQELYDSPSPANKRAATMELGKIVKHVTDKLYPSLFRTETVNINVDLNKLQTIEQQIYETLNRLPPNTRTQFWEHWNQVTQEWKTQPLQQPTNLTL